MARALYAAKWVPDLVLSSTSKRTTQTWKLMGEVFAEAGVKGVEVHFTRALYHAGLEDLRTVMSTKPVLKKLKDANTVLVLGHNPGWQGMVERLSGERHVKMTTANTALLTFGGGSWREIIAQEGRWALDRVLRPKELSKK